MPARTYESYKDINQTILLTIKRCCINSRRRNTIGDERGAQNEGGEGPIHMLFMILCVFNEKATSMHITDNLFLHINRCWMWTCGLIWIQFNKNALSHWIGSWMMGENVQVARFANVFWLDMISAQRTHWEHSDELQMAEIIIVGTYSCDIIHNWLNQLERRWSQRVNNKLTRALALHVPDGAFRSTSVRISLSQARFVHRCAYPCVGIYYFGISASWLSSMARHSHELNERVWSIDLSNRNSHKLLIVSCGLRAHETI